MKSVPLYHSDGSPILSRSSYPSYQELANHADKYGLTNHRQDGYGRKRPFKTYRSLAKDPLLKVAYDCLGEFEYAALVAHIGYEDWQEEAREDWVSGHNQGNVPSKPAQTA